ncbi:agmatinase [Bacteroidetes bacterium endosymbiont of Geopemphigus sp.]|uniref:agmatinase n=1 Tax=Bacteroidetes bacterium endosymbiont of Geopemphigus sp. TaxID=2047937 RepID=UPI0018A86130|nr:agmatinase [Bacteroidetes bacterium endosymbiont of Geopemphigus sp.]
MKTFAGIPQEYAKFKNSQVVLIPIPYDGTSTWGKGADKGPAAFLQAAENIELYDIETDAEVYKRGIFLAPALQENFSAEKMVKKVYTTTKEYLSFGKFVTLIGGEHSISIGSLRAFREQFPTLSVLQLDAHADLRPHYQGTPYNHACALHESTRRGPLVQVGIRSMDIEEKKYVQQGNIFYAHKLDEHENWIQKLIDRLSKKVFITIDLDAFDPSIAPSTGTPEPGGLLWYSTLKLLRKVFEQKEVVGFDIVELAPNPKEPSTDFLAAKLYYKLLSYRFEL